MQAILHRLRLRHPGEQQPREPVGSLPDLELLGVVVDDDPPERLEPPAPQCLGIGGVDVHLLPLEGHALSVGRDDRTGACPASATGRSAPTPMADCQRARMRCMDDIDLAGTPQAIPVGESRCPPVLRCSCSWCYGSGSRANVRTPSLVPSSRRGAARCRARAWRSGRSRSSILALASHEHRSDRPACQRRDVGDGRARSTTSKPATPQTDTGGATPRCGGPRLDGQRPSVRAAAPWARIDSGRPVAAPIDGSLHPDLAFPQTMNPELAPPAGVRRSSTTSISGSAPAPRSAPPSDAARPLDEARHGGPVGCLADHLGLAIRSAANSLGSAALRRRSSEGPYSRRGATVTTGGKDHRRDSRTAAICRSRCGCLAGAGAARPAPPSGRCRRRSPRPPWMVDLE